MFNESSTIKILPMLALRTGLGMPRSGFRPYTNKLQLSEAGHFSKLGNIVHLRMLFCMYFSAALKLLRKRDCSPA